MKEMFKSVVHMIIMDNNKILLQKRKGSKLWPGYYALPAGHIDEGENQYDALVREAKEELGIEINLGDIANSYGESAFNYNRNAVGKNNGDKNVSILRIIPSNEVKFADYKELWTEWFDLKEQRAKISDCDEEYYYILKNIGIYAMLKGYDAIALNGFGGFDYVIILNRGKFIVEE